MSVLGLSRSSRLLSVSCNKPFLFFSVFKFSHTLHYFSPSPTRGFYSINVTTLIQPSAVNTVEKVSSREPEGWTWFGSLCGPWYQWSGNFCQQDCSSGLCWMSSQQLEGLCSQWRARGRRTWSCFKHISQLDYQMEVMPWEHNCSLWLLMRAF